MESDSDADGVGVPADALNLAGSTFGTPGSTIGSYVPCNEAIVMLSSDAVDAVRPTLLTASPNEPRTSSDGTKVILTFDEPLSATTALAGAFTVMVSGMERTVSAVAVDDDDVNLTLGSAAGMMDTITVAYTDPTTDNDANAVQDAAGNDLVTFDAQAVTNNAPAGVTISSIALKDDAGVDDTHKTGDVVTATVTLSEAVGLTGTPHLELDVGGKARTALCALATDTTKLECTYTIVAGETDTDGIAIGANSLSLNGAVFTKASTDPGGLVLTHDAVAANSDNKVDAVLPTLVKMGTNRPHASSDGTKVILTFSETIGTVDRTKMTFKSGTTMLTTTADSKSGATVEITLMTALTTADTEVTVELAAAAVTDFAGNAIAAVDPTEVIVEDTTAPMLTSLTAPSPTEVLLSYDEELDSTSIPGASHFDVKVGGTARTVSSAAMSGTMGIVLTVSPAFALGDALTATYRVPGTNPIQDIAENEAGAFTDRTVTNTLAAPGKPTSLAVGTETPTTIPLTWTAPDETGTDAISSYTLERAPDTSGSAGSWSTLWTGTETAYTDEGLAPETTYHYRVAATNSVGTGDASDATSGMTTAAPLVTIAVGPSADPKSTITEGDADNPAAIFTITRTGDTSEPISVNVTLTQDGAYVAPADLGDVAVALAAGASEATLTRTVINDVLAEDNGSLSAELKARTTAGPYTLGTDTSATITIENEDTVPDAPSLTAIGHDTKLVLNWAKPAEGTSSITRYDYRYKETAGAESTWSMWTDTGLSAANALNEFEVGGLTNGTQYTVEVTATSAAGTSLAGPAMGTPTPAPSVTSVDITSDPDIDKTYAIDDDIVVTVTFDKALTLGTGTGDPTLALTIGTATRTADCVLGTGATTLVCTYPVVEGDEAPSGLAIAANALTAGARTIVGPAPAEQTANLSHAVKTPDANHKVDGVKPTPASANVDGTTLTLVWDEPLDTAAAPAGSSFTVGVDSGTAPTVSTVTLEGSTATLTLSAAADTTKKYTLNYTRPEAGGIRDKAGNFAESFTGQSVSTIVLTWSFTVSADTIREGETAPVTVTATITNENYTPPAAITVDFEWGGTAIGGTDAPGNFLEEAGGATSVTIPAMATDLTASLALTAPNDDVFTPRTTAALTATQGGNEIGNEDLTFVNDDDPPTVTLAASKSEVNEGDTFTLTATATLASSIAQTVPVTATGTTAALTETLPAQLVIDAGETAKTVTLTAEENTVQNDGARNVTFTAGASADATYALGTPKAATVSVLDDDTPPSAPRDIGAAPGDQQVTLTWQAPETTHGQGITKYQYHLKTDTDTGFGTVTDVPSSTADTTEHTVTGLTNGTTYLFQVRAVNDLHEGAWSDTAQTTVGASWELTLIDANGNPLTELTEGGPDFTARLRITNSVTFATQETITIQLLAHTYTATIGAGETTIDVAVPIPDDDLHRPGGPFEITVFALHGANSLASKTINVVDDEDPPVLTLTLDKDRIVEGESVIATAMLTHGYTTPVTADIADATGDIAKIATSSIDHTNPVLTLSFIAGTTASVPGTIDTLDGSTPGDHGELVLTVRGDNALFRAGPVRTFTVTILDDDTAPSAPRSLRATGGNGQVRLTWQRPASYDTTTLTGYELKVTPAVGDFTSFADIPGGDAETTRYTVTGLTNDTTYTFEVRAENDAGASTAASATATPRNEGVFIDPTTITEGGETTITLLPQGHTVRIRKDRDRRARGGGHPRRGRAEHRRHARKRRRGPVGDQPAAQRTGAPRDLPALQHRVRGRGDRACAHPRRHRGTPSPSAAKTSSSTPTPTTAGAPSNGSPKDRSPAPTTCSSRTTTAKRRSRAPSSTAER